MAGLAGGVPLCEVRGRLSWAWPSRGRAPEGIRRRIGCHRPGGVGGRSSARWRERGRGPGLVLVVSRAWLRVGVRGIGWLPVWLRLARRIARTGFGGALILRRTGWPARSGTRGSRAVAVLRAKLLSQRPGLGWVGVGVGVGEVVQARPGGQFTGPVCNRGR